MTATTGTVEGGKGPDLERVFPPPWLRRFGSMFLNVYAGFGLLFLFLPIFVIVAFSFNEPKGRFNLVWQNFTLDNWKNPFAVPELVELALRNGGPKSDNVTVLCVEWESAEDTDSPTGVSTENMGDDVFASTIQASLLGEGQPDELDDAEIERSIREINEAIQRSSQRKH